MPELAIAILIAHTEVFAILGGRSHTPAVQFGNSLRPLEHLDIGRELLVAIWVAPHRIFQTYSNIDTEHCRERSKIQSSATCGAHRDHRRRLYVADLADHQYQVGNQVARIGHPG